MRKIILDCDPGHDDMMAIILAAASNKIEFKGITTVAGNQTGEKTFDNARRILTLINRKDIPLARGCDKPLMRKLRIAPEIHGVSGLDGAELPMADAPYLNCHAVDFIINTLKESTEKITLAPTGPLTNIALALIKAPEIKEKIEEIILMGGGVFDSNITPAAEFNILVDPEAARTVFLSGLPLAMVSLDVTNKSLMTFEQIEEVINWNGKISSVVGPLLKFFANANYENFGFNGAPVHDALVIASIIDDEIVTYKDYFVDIETKGELTLGQTVTDVYGVTGKKPNCRVSVKADTKKFVSNMMNAIKELDGK